MGHFVGFGVLVADNEFWILRYASRYSKKSQNEAAKSEGWLYCNRIQWSPSRHTALKQKQIFFYSGAQNTVKGEVHPRTHGPKGEQRYSSTPSLTSGIDGVDSQCHAPAALPQGKRTVPYVQKTGWAPGTIWTVAENLAQLNWNLPGEEVG